MDYGRFVKKFQLPANFKAPTELRYKKLIARPLRRTDLAEDLTAVNSSLEIIRNTRGGSWPSEKLSEDFDALDLAWHEREFRDGDSFAYVVYDDRGGYIGCFYLYPMGYRTKLSDLLKEYDADASWWVTSKAYKSGQYETLYEALREWLSSDFPFKNTYFSNTEVPN